MEGAAGGGEVAERAGGEVGGDEEELEGRWVRWLYAGWRAALVLGWPVGLRNMTDVVCGGWWRRRREAGGGLQIACASRCSHRRLCACVTQGIVVARQLREHVTGGQCFAKALCTGRI